MNEEKYRELFSGLRLSDGARAELKELPDTAQPARRGLGRPMKLALAAAAAVGALVVTATAAGGYMGGWEDSDWSASDYQRGNFEYARAVRDDTPDDPSDDMVELPLFAIGEGLEDHLRGSDRVIYYLYMARGAETLFDRVFDVTDELAASPDNSWHYEYADEDVRIDVTVLLQEDQDGYRERGTLAIYDTAADTWVELPVNGGGVLTWLQYYKKGDTVHEPVYVPASWERGPLATNEGLEWLHRD